MMHRLRLWAATLASGVYWAIGGAAFLLLALILGPILTPAKSRAIGLGMIQRAFQGFAIMLRWFRIVECEYEGFENLAACQGGFILAPNHPAIWDVVFIMGRVGGLTCILKSALLRNPLMAGGARLARFIPNEPASEMVKRCIDGLQKGEHLLLFPEGTRTRKWEGCLNDFRGGISLVAKHANVPVFPVFVKTDSDYGSKRWPAWKAPPETVHIRMRLGEPLTCGPDETTHAFLERLRAPYLAALSGSTEE